MEVDAEDITVMSVDAGSLGGGDQEEEEEEEVLVG